MVINIFNGLQTNPVHTTRQNGYFLHLRASKLDQIEKEVTTANAHPLKREYVCRGLYRDVGSTPQAAIYISDFAGQENVQIFNDMAHANNSNDWGKLLILCSAQISSQPEWLAPYLYCAMAEIGLGHTVKAREMIEHYDNHTAGVHDDPPCSTMADYIHAQLMMNPSTNR